ncbi:MAG: asparagine synthase (glutamine-hydrolyzing) [Polyangiaceae bacterium UTPRO1]|jgi:asparagine synthase (glutamine-hydrolysing)|nr:asparagine synthase (glutamine-hydrolyzing) [Myxococcales bacterium]OQY69147.1 MAG: asparagine synthase (glutamine-hydrolyzing) [Polyangiaceae bacterium UTPRO1]
MCGIVGYFHATDAAAARFDAAAAPRVLEPMLALMHHRGPDEAGYYYDLRTGLGTARLSIIDLATGQQPISDASGRFWIAFNGELYNYKELRAELEALGHGFRSTSDTEVMLHAYMQWGTAVLPRLNAAYACAIYDREREELLLARDRYGKRPLFYAQVDGTLVFASEMKSFLAFPGVRFEIDEAQLASIFTIWTPLPHQSGFAGIHQIPNGSYLLQRGTARSIAAYTTLDWPQEGRFTGSADEAIERTRGVLSEAVRLRLRSDVEVATYLSGGLDSAITTQLALANGLSRVHSFSITFDDKEFDESADQLALSRYLGTQHTALPVRHGDIARAFPAAIWHGEVPVFRTAFVPMFLLSKLVNDKGIKVVLTGEGSDESFLGYDIFKEALLRDGFEADRDAEKLRRLYPYLPHFNDANMKALASVFGQFAREKTPGLFSHELRFHNSLFGLRLLKEQRDGLADVKRYLADNAAVFGRLGLVERAQWLEWKTLLPGYLLSTQGDRMSMAHSVEGRCPFLDFRVVEWAARLPQELKLGPDMDEKWILKRAFPDTLPPSILAKPKQPYRAPDLSAFLGAADADYTEALFSERELAKLPFLNGAFCRQFLKKVRTAPPGGISQRENQAFILLLSTALLHRYFVQREHPRREVRLNLVRAIDGRALSAA